MKESHKFLKVFIFVQIGACCGRVLAKYLDYINHPDLYAMQSVPWYTSIILTVILTAVMVSITTMAYFVVGRMIKKRKQEQTD